ncbi:MAG: murein L,D-transpeptidase family protein [Hyphomicrobium sp.]
MSLKRRQNILLSSFGMTIPGTPNLAHLDRRLEEKGLSIGSPVLFRIFKREFELELWMMNKNKRYVLFATYPICNWSGALGPKLATGDKQAPEGFYWVDRGALNPNSRQHLSFNLGFPNTYDRTFGRTGHALMVHGGCTSVGCFAMTDSVMDEIWTIINPAFDGGQKRFQVQVYPFRMTKDNLSKFANSNWKEFWNNLKVGYDLFEEDRLPPQVNVCDKVYAFSSSTNSYDEPAPILAQCR